MERPVSDPRAYEQVVGVFKKHQSGITLADVAAGTGLPLVRVRELTSLASDEFSARLEVTESGEILYSFPRGFVSRYRGFRHALKRGLGSLGRFLAAAGKLLFKGWIVVMLLGYFLLFMAIALASLFISLSANSNGRRSNERGGGPQGGWNVSLGIFDLIIRLWFYSELFGGSPPRRSFGSGSYPGISAPGRTKGRPLHKAVFSFVFGEDDPNRDRDAREKKAFISYVRSRRGVVSLPELMTLTGLPPEKAEACIAALCVEFGGSPEASLDGTVVYRFDEILLTGKDGGQEEKGGENKGQVLSELGGLPSPLFKRLRVFSANPGKMNGWFALINGVNLLFGTYFLYNAVTIGRIVSEAQLRGTGMYGMVYALLYRLGLDLPGLIETGLGFVPLLFSVLFWLIPAIRRWLLKKENENVRLGNFRGLGYGRIWASPENFRPGELNPEQDECCPQNLAYARDRVLKEMGSYSMPEVSLDEKQHEVFNFPGLRRERDALEKYRAGVDLRRMSPGKTVFDSAD
jgi:hypothetical protein